jgi:hypothetical protein
MPMIKKGFEYWEKTLIFEEITRKVNELMEQEYGVQGPEYYKDAETAANWNKL